MYNRFRPVGLRTPNAYGFTGTRYNAADIPGYARATPQGRDWLEQTFSYEWYDWSDRYRHESNPPFRTGAAGVLLPGLTAPSGQPARILRGFIRRAEFEVNNRASFSRLYFMYNPEIIVRDYVSYLDQGALDPFNTVFESKNLVAPPSFLDFSFQLFFDRQDEAQAPNNPGVFVDLEYFDLVVRNVIPRSRPTANTLPDSGVMMVNPRDIAVVFSPNITVQGRPLNARIAFEKFTHRMVPTRMRIDLTMRVIYIGPMRDMVEYKNEEFAYANTVPWGEIKNEHYEFRYNELDVELPTPASEDRNQEREDLENANRDARKKILDYVKNQTGDHDTKYTSGPNRDQYWEYANGPSMVWGGFKDLVYAQGAGFPLDHSPTVSEIHKLWTAANTARAVVKPMAEGGNNQAPLWKQFEDELEYGDILLRVGGDETIAFFESSELTWVGSDKEYRGGFVKVFRIMGDGAHSRKYHMMEPSERNVLESFTHWARPTPIGNTVGGPPGGTVPVGAELQRQIIAVGDWTMPYYLADVSEWCSGTGESVPLVNARFMDPYEVFFGDWLDWRAAASIKRVSEKSGQHIHTIGCFRSKGYQLKRQGDPDGGADRFPSPKPGGTFHCTGLAVDVDYQDNPDALITAFESEGWNRFDPTGTAHHWSYIVEG
jgi:hypothetical protein